MTKPVKPVHHGIIDYIFAGIQIAVPATFGLNKKARSIYAINGAVFGLMNALTDTPVAVRPVLSFKRHQKADAVFLASLAAISFADFILKDKKATGFHFSFFATTITHYVLTDYNADTNKGLNNT